MMLSTFRFTARLAGLTALLALALAPPRSATAQDAAPAIPAHDSTYSFPANERMADYLKRTAGAEAIFNSSLLAGIDQWRDRPEGWEQGGAGYGRRFVSRLGRGAISNTIQLGLEAALREDSRYTALEHGPIGQRLGHSLSHTFMVRTPGGRRAPPIGRFAGIVGGAVLSRRWYPEGENTFEDGARAAGISLGVFTGINVLREFLPDIKRLFGRD